MISLRALLSCSALMSIASGCDRSTLSTAVHSSSDSSATASASRAVEETTFDDVKFEIPPEGEFHPSLLTEENKALIGKRIRIRGYMYPTTRKSGLKNFVLVRDNLECCFGPGAALYDCIAVNLADDATAEFSIRPVAVSGQLRFEELRYDGDLLAIYHLDDSRVE